MGDISSGSRVSTANAGGRCSTEDILLMGVSDDVDALELVVGWEIS